MTASAIPALMWKAAVPAGQYPEHSWPRIVRQGKSAPSSPRTFARSRASSSVDVTPPKGVARRVGRGVGEDREDERLGVPEGVPVVPGSGQALRRDRPLLGTSPSLQGVKEREADRLLQL